MCRNIKTLFNFDPPVTPEEVRAASLQFVRKISGFNKPSQANEASFLGRFVKAADFSHKPSQEGGFVCLGRFVKAADFSHELERCGPNFFWCHRRIEASFLAAVDEIAGVSIRLLRSLETNAPAKNREEEAAKLKARAGRFGA